MTQTESRPSVSLRVGGAASGRGEPNGKREPQEKARLYSLYVAQGSRQSSDERHHGESVATLAARNVGKVSVPRRKEHIDSRSAAIHYI